MLCGSNAEEFVMQDILFFIHRHYNSAYFTAAVFANVFSVFVCSFFFFDNEETVYQNSIRLVNGSHGFPAAARSTSWTRRRLHWRDHGRLRSWYQCCSMRSTDRSSSCPWLAGVSLKHNIPCACVMTCIPIICLSGLFINYSNNKNRSF